MKHEFAEQTAGLIKDYQRARELFEKAGLNDELKRGALDLMATALQMQSLALANEINSLQIQGMKKSLNEQKKSE